MPDLKNELKDETDDGLLQKMLQKLDKDLSNTVGWVGEEPPQQLAQYLLEVIKRGLVKGVSLVAAQEQPSPPGLHVVMLPPAVGKFGALDVVVRTPTGHKITMLEALGEHCVEKQGRVAAVLAWEDEGHTPKSTSILEMMGFEAHAALPSLIDDGAVKLHKIEATLPSTIDADGVVWLKKGG